MTQNNFPIASKVAGQIPVTQNNEPEEVFLMTEDGFILTAEDGKPILLLETKTSAGE